MKVVSHFRNLRCGLCLRQRLNDPRIRYAIPAADQIAGLVHDFL
jgi:hypothetical protein